MLHFICTNYTLYTFSKKHIEILGIFEYVLSDILFSKNQIKYTKNQKHAFH